jgi:hypothetical protein
VLYSEFGGQPFATLPLQNLLVLLGEGFSLLAECRDLQTKVCVEPYACVFVLRG